MPREKFQIKPIRCRVELSIWNDPGREESENEKGRDDFQSQGFLEELPCDRNVIVPADVRDEEVSQLGGRESQPVPVGGRVESGAELNRPCERVGVLVLRRLRQFQHFVPYTPLLMIHRHQIPGSSSRECRYNLANPIGLCIVNSFHFSE